MHSHIMLLFHHIRYTMHKNTDIYDRCPALWNDVLWDFFLQIIWKLEFTVIDFIQYYGRELMEYSLPESRDPSF